jgi:hypothetical protein
VPTLGALLKHFVITFLVLFDKPLETDVAADFQAAVITSKQK